MHVSDAALYLPDSYLCEIGLVEVYNLKGPLWDQDPNLCPLPNRPVERLSEDRNVSSLFEDQKDFFLYVLADRQDLKSRRWAGRNSWERVYPWTVVLPRFPEAQPPLSRSENTQTDQTSALNTHYLIKVPKGLAPDPAWHPTSTELSSHQPRLLMGRERH